MTAGPEDNCVLMNIDGGAFRALQRHHMDVHRKYVHSELELGFYFSQTSDGYIEDPLGQDLVAITEHVEKPQPQDILDICAHAYDKLADQHEIPWPREDWLKACSQDGQALGCTAVTRHSDDGVAKYPNRLLIVTKARENRTFHLYTSKDYESPDLSHEIRDGDLIQFDESIVHELVWSHKTIPGFDGSIANWADEHDGVPPEVLCWFITAPSPFLQRIEEAHDSE